MQIIIFKFKGLEPNYNRESITTVSKSFFLSQRRASYNWYIKFFVNCRVLEIGSGYELG